MILLISLIFSIDDLRKPFLTFFLFFSFFFASYSCAQPIELSFQDLNDSQALFLNGKEIQIRGFLYSMNEEHPNQWILAAQPDLRSCCIGTSSKIKQQIIVKGEMIPSPHAVNIEGIFLIDSQRDREGNLSQLYVLDHAQVISTKATLKPWEIIVGALLILTMIYIKLRFFKKLEMF